MEPLLVTLFQTRTDAALDVQTVLGQIQQDWGELLEEEFDEVSAEALTGAPGLGVDVHVMSFTFDDLRVVVADTRMPHDLDVVAAAAASPFWDTERALPEVDGPSLLVMALPAVADEAELEEYFLDDDRDAVDEATWISHVVTSLLACTESVSAVYLATSEQIAAPDRYREAALDVAPDLPLMLWIDFLVADESGTVSGETLGLADLGLADIEIGDCELPADEVIKVLVDSAVLLYDEGMVIGDGELIESEFGNFVASFGPSKYELEQVVLRLAPVVAANRAERRAAARKRKRR